LTRAVTDADGRLSDAVRLRRLRETGMLGGAPYPSLDRLARAAAHQLRAGWALISLLDADRRVVAGSAVPPPAHTFCRMVLDTDAPLLIGDARTDERIGEHPAVADGVIAYAGFPLRSPDGYLLGTFCVLDSRPREWEPRELLLIEDLAATAQTEMELRAAARLSEQALARRRRGEMISDLQLGVARVLADATTPEQAADGAAEAVARAMGWAFGEFWQVDDAAGTISRAGHWCDPAEDLSTVTGDRPFTLHRGEGLAGNIWAAGNELWATEVADDPRIVAREDQVRAAGLHAAIGVPVRSDDRIVGVLLFFSTAADRPDDELIVALDGVCAHLGRHLERRRAEQLTLALAADQQAQNRRLRRLDRLKDELVALVSHELRNPLAAIRSYAETLLDDPGLTAEQRHLTEVIDRRSGHMQHLVDDLLDAARLETGRLQLDPKPISAARMIREVVEAHRPAAAARSVTVTVGTPRHLPVRADAVRLRQVLDNLLANAIKYTPDGGSVRVEAGAGPRPETTAVVVSDSGIGIPEEQYPQLFERFFRASNAVQRGIKGTGLGLAITKAIVEAHGGSIAAAPAPGGGTSFTVVLPAG
jgi:signal transduction histidine kinase